MIAQTRTYFFVAFLFAANIFDVVNTCYLFQDKSIFEANPFIKYLMELHGCHIGSTLIKAPALLLLLWFVRYKQTPRTIRLIVTATSLYAVLTAYHIFLLVFIYGN
ncbi:MAG: DUF5658 family protein [Nitrosopumilaceae archaeon]